MVLSNMVLMVGPFKNHFTWRVTEGHREREGRGVKFLENEAEGYEDFLVDKA